MLSKYARKKMLEKVAAQYSDEQLEFLNQNEHFRQVCAEAESQEPVIKLAQTLIQRMPRKRSPLPTRLQGPNPDTKPPVAPAPFVNPIPIPDLPNLAEVSTP